ncbi:MAG: hypothetical protein JXP34_23680, partial [Planctomycetes bacterium]|nr:hypothetical protein [Planctomycetota bacterium]
LTTEWSDKVGYLRITGGMDDATVAAFHQAFDGLEGMKALLLDCRGMGGGGDGPAWEMAGRLFPERTANGRGRFLMPTGSWQFAGPVVMLQDETEVSSAETFTWAVSETGRVVSVGRPTGGWSIIPTVLKCPSGLASFRLGVTDRPTPITGQRTEGTGWPPDVLVPYGPAYCARPDPVREIGMDVLCLLAAGIPRATVLALFRDLAEGDLSAFKSMAAKLIRKVPKWRGDALLKTRADDLAGTIALEAALLTSREIVVPDALGAAKRYASLAAAAKKARLTTPIAGLNRAVTAAKEEAAAQEAFLALMAVDPDAKTKAEFLKRYAGTRVGTFAKTVW